MFSPNRMRVALAGDSGSGKDSVGNILQEEHGVTHVSCSDFLRGLIVKNNWGEPDRATCTSVASELRATNGASYLVDLCLQENEHLESLTISGIYSPAEAERFKAIGGQVVLIVCRPDLTRYQRIIERQHPRDRLTFEEFLAAQKRENSGDRTQQDVSGITEVADFHLYNEGTIDDLRHQAGLTYERIVERAYGTVYH